LDAIGIAGAYYSTGGPNKDNDNRNYCRVWKHIDITDEATRTKFLAMLGETVFNNVVMRVTVDPLPESKSEVATFIGSLHEQSNLFFTNPCYSTTAADEKCDKSADDD